MASVLNRGENSVELYDHYLEDENTNSVGSAWEDVARTILDDFEKINVAVNDKTILDISGGPGFVIKDLSRFCKTTAVSEYSPNSVKRMSELLHLNAFQYDFNKDDISTKIEEKFDVVLIRHSLNFCLDVNAMLKSLKEILNRDALIYVTFVMPTLGTCIRWQLEDYIYHTLYNPETMSKIFAEERFEEVTKYFSTDRHYLEGKKIFFPLLFSYRLLNSFKKNINTSLRAKSAVMIFRLV